MGIKVVAVTADRATSRTSVSRLRVSVQAADTPLAAVEYQGLSAATLYANPVVGAAYTLPAAQIAYIDLKLGVLLDTSGRFRYIPDMVVVSDDVALLVNKALTSDFNVNTEFVSLETNKELFDSVTFAEVFVASLTYIRSFADSIAVPDARTMAFAKALADSFTFSESVTRVFSKTLSSGVAMNDSFDAGDGAVYSFTKGVSNVVFAQDAVAKGPHKGLSDSQGLTDTQAFVFAKALASAAVIADALATDVDKALVDAFAPTDALAFLIAKLVDPDSVSIADATALSSQKAISDMIEPVDAGSLVSQNYCDITYFAEDYVGESRTFT
jgi:hypothetical protein